MPFAEKMHFSGLTAGLVLVRAVTRAVRVSRLRREKGALDSQDQ